MSESPIAERPVFTIRLAGGVRQRCTWEDAVHLIGKASGVPPERRDGEADSVRAAIREELRQVVFRNTFTGVDAHACPEPQFFSEPVVCDVRGILCTTIDHESVLLAGEGATHG